MMNFYNENNGANILRAIMGEDYNIVGIPSNYLFDSVMQAAQLASNAPIYGQQSVPYSKIPSYIKDHVNQKLNKEDYEKLEKQLTHVTEMYFDEDNKYGFHVYITNPVDDLEFAEQLMNIPSTKLHEIYTEALQQYNIVKPLIRNLNKLKTMLFKLGIEFDVDKMFEKRTFYNFTQSDIPSTYMISYFYMVKHMGYSLDVDILKEEINKVEKQCNFKNSTQLLSDALTYEMLTSYIQGFIHRLDKKINENKVQSNLTEIYLLKQSLQKKEDQIKAAHSEICELGQTIANQNHELDVLRKANEELKKLSSSYGATLLSEKINQLQNELDRKTKKIDELKEAHVKSAQANQKLKEENEKLKQTAQSLQNSVDKLNESIITEKHAKELLQQENIKLRKDNFLDNVKRNHAAENIDNSKSVAEELKEVVDSFNEKYQQVTKDIEKILFSQKEVSKDEEIERLKKELAAANEEINLLRTIQ